MEGIVKAEQLLSSSTTLQKEQQLLFAAVGRRDIMKGS